MHRRIAVVAALLIGGLLVGAPAARAAEDISFGPVRYDSRPHSGQGFTPATVRAMFHTLPTGAPDYCVAALGTLVGASNGDACNGLHGALGVYARMHFDIVTSGAWSFRFGPDAGSGAVFFIDGNVVDSSTGDIEVPEGGFWDPSFTNPTAHLDATVELAEGPHVIEVFEFEGCCDGPWGAQYRQGDGDWLPIPTGATTPDTDGDGFADLIDSCIDDSNPAQLDIDDDGEGDACETGPTNGAPTIDELPAAISAEAVGPQGAIVHFTRPTASDPEDGPLGVVCTQEPDTVYPIGETVVVCSATDGLGVTAETSTTITVTDEVVDVVVADVEVAEGATGTQTPALITVQLSSPTDHQVKVTLSSVRGTATPAADYREKGGVVVRIPAGQTTASEPWNVFGDNHDERDETFSVVLSAAVGVVLTDNEVTVKILDDDGPATLSVVSEEVIEGSGVPMTNAHAHFHVDSLIDRDITISWREVSGSATSDDAHLASGTVVLRSRKPDVRRPIDVIGDHVVEGDESFTVQITAVSVGSGSGQLVFGDLTATIVIHDDDLVFAE